MSLDVYLETRRCPVCGKYDVIYSNGITHNLVPMAQKLGIYKHLWRPEEIGIKTAGELIEPLREAVKKMRRRPEFFRKFDSPNGWGKYADFLLFLERLLNACELNPDCTIAVSR